MIHRILFLSLLSLSFASCKREPVFTEVKVNNSYSLLIPEYLHPCTDLHKEASLQYQNIEKEIYAIVIDEKKKTMQDYSLEYDLDTYFKNITSQGFAENVKGGKISIPGRQEINGHKALIADVNGMIGDNEVYYKLAVIETPYEFYQLLFWTRAENRKELEPDFIKMIESFKELPHPAEELPAPKLSDSVNITPAW